MRFFSKKLVGFATRVLLFAFLLILPACNIKKTDNIALVEQNATQDTLVLFDVDNTMIVAENGFNNWVNKKAISTWKPLMKKLSKNAYGERFKILLSRMGMNSKSVLVNADFPRLIKRLNGKKIKSIALTKYMPGKFGDNKNSEENRFKELKHLGIDFRPSFPKLGNFSLTELKKHKVAPVYHKGILITAKYSKGQALEAFLNRIKSWPKKIIFLDDSLDNVQDLKQLCGKKGIEYLGIHYQGAKNIPCGSSPEVAKTQMEHLIKNGKWLTTKEVEMEKTKEEIKGLVDLETKSWNTKDADLFLSIIHPDMVWPWPRTSKSHDPADWMMVLGKYDYNRWKKINQELFDTHDLVHNNRKIVKITVSEQKDAALAVVDIDTLWRHKETGKDNHWKGRVSKTYTKVDGTWKLITHTGVLQY